MEDQSKSKASVVNLVNPISRQSGSQLHLKQKHKQLSQIKTNKTQHNSLY